MNYKHIVIASNVDCHAEANSIITDNPDVELGFRYPALFDDDGHESAALMRITEKAGCTVESYRIMDGGMVTIKTREVENLFDLLNCRLDTHAGE